MIETFQLEIFSYLEIDRFGPHSENIIFEPIPKFKFSFGVFFKKKQKKQTKTKIHTENRIDYL